jgi:hypothetical protein
MTALGYRYDEFDKVLPPVQDNCSFTYLRPKVPLKRKPMMVSIGACDPRAVPPHVDLNDPLTYLAGCQYRIAVKKPRPSRKLLRRMRRFARKWVRQFEQVSPDSDFSLEAWLANTNYPEWRKVELRAAFAEGGHDNVVKSFGKDETYTEMKHLRTINSRSDYWKCVLGPAIKLVEKQIFKSAKFVKYVKVEDRFRYIYNRIWSPAGVYDETDYSQFESHFINEVRDAIMGEVYSYMLGHLDMFTEWWENYVKTVMCTIGQWITSKFFSAKGVEAEMSGEMDTSLTNGVTNCFLYDFFHFMAGNTENHMNVEGKARGAFEGDDGVTTHIVDNPVSGTSYRSAGFDIKMKTSKDIRGTDFCGVIGETDTFMCTTDPRNCLAEFGWCMSKYVNSKRVRKLELLRAKALSYYHQYRGSPIIQALALYGLRITKHIDMQRFVSKDRYINNYDRDQLIAAIEYYGRNIEVPQVSPGLRHEVESRFGVSIRDQLSIESYLNDLTKLQFFDCPQIYDIMPNAFLDYASRYVQDSREEREPFVIKRYDNFNLSQRPHHVTNWSIIPQR